VFLWVFALVDAIIAARRAGRIALTAYNRWYVYIGVIAASGSIAVLTDFLPIPSTRSYSMPSGSMRPPLEVGDYMDAATHAFADRMPERGEIAVFKRPGGAEDYVKRIIAFPGDRVQMRGGILYLNDQPMPRERVGDYRLPDRGETLTRYRETLSGGRNYQIIVMSDDGPLDNTALSIVPAGNVFVLGDNRDNSSDSRSFGFGPLDNLKDRPFVIWWSRDRSRIGMGISSSASGDHGGGDQGQYHGQAEIEQDEAGGRDPIHGKRRLGKEPEVAEEDKIAEMREGVADA